MLYGLFGLLVLRSSSNVLWPLWSFVLNKMEFLPLSKTTTPFETNWRLNLAMSTLSLEVASCWYCHLLSVFLPRIWRKINLPRSSNQTLLLTQQTHPILPIWKKIPCDPNPTTKNAHTSNAWQKWRGSAKRVVWKVLSSMLGFQSEMAWDPDLQVSQIEFYLTQF